MATEQINIITEKSEAIKTIDRVINCLENEDTETDHYDCVDDLRDVKAFIAKKL